MRRFPAHVGIHLVPVEPQQAGADATTRQPFPGFGVEPHAEGVECRELEIRRALLRRHPRGFDLWHIGGNRPSHAATVEPFRYRVIG